MTTTAPTAPVAPAATEFGQMLVALLWVVGATAAGLSLLGSVPDWLVGETSAARSLPSLAAAEAWVRAPLALPAFYPERLAWPPAEVRVAGGVGGAVSLILRARDGRGPPVELIQAVAPGVPIPPELLSTSAELETSRTTLGSRPAVRARVLVAGTVWDELRWERDGRAMVARTRGDLEELMRMARSTHLRGSP
jgi:hypothetical protein